MMARHVEIHLDECEVIIARWLAARRVAWNQANRITQAAASNTSPMELQFLGARGEIALAKHLNICPDLTAGKHIGPFDLLTPFGTIDVKATDCFRGKLIAQASVAKVADGADCFALAVIPSEALVILPGWATRAELLDPRNIDSTFRSRPFSLHQRQLHSWPEWGIANLSDEENIRLANEALARDREVFGRV